MAKAQRAIADVRENADFQIGAANSERDTAREQVRYDWIEENVCLKRRF